MDGRVLLGVLIASCALSACSKERVDASQTIGDAQNGRQLISRYGCGSCHTIPHVSQAQGTVGPPLSGIAGRSYVGGVLANTPDNLILWIRNPQGVDPRTAMPTLGVSDAEAHDIAAYLLTLK